MYKVDCVNYSMYFIILYIDVFSAIYCTKI